MKNAILTFKHTIKRELLNVANIRHIHIIGCSRSGTTMLHYSMSAFANTILFDKETNPINRPGFAESVELAIKLARQPQQKWYISKRPAQWWHDNIMEATIDYILRNDIFVINIVRDPRDVLTSHHPGEDRPYYVTPYLWAKSIQAGEYFEKRLLQHGLIKTIRYEDIICRHEQIAESLQKRLGLEFREGVQGWHLLKDNVEQLKLDGRMVKYMHKLRNFDPATIGRWQQDGEKKAYLDMLINRKDLRASLEKFASKYGYDLSSESHPIARPVAPDYRPGELERNLVA